VATSASGTSAFGALGAWVPRTLPADELAVLATTLEETGYGAMWISGGGEPGVFDAVAVALAATERITVATGVVNIWMETPESVTDAWHRIEAQWPGRLQVGLGISHAPTVERAGRGTYERPLARIRGFLDALDAQPDPLPPERRVLGALGPKMQRLAAERTAGSHPYLVTVENTAAARAGVGPDRVVVPELGVVLSTDLPTARELARQALARYFGLPNYTNNWLRSGFTEDDLADGGSDRLIDALVAMGDVDAVARRVQEHRDAGADSVALQVLGPRPHAATAFRELAALLP
jgi:probable F420-dependent oxidoreductase